MNPCKAIFVCPRCETVYEANVEARIGSNTQVQAPKLQRPRLCMECYRLLKQEEAQQLAFEMNLPILHGWTEKQISYAFSLRNKYVRTNSYKIEKVQYEIKRIDPDLVKQEAKKAEISEHSYLTEAFRRQGLLEAYLCLTETNANALIEALRN